MQLVFSPHARVRMRERGVTERDVRETIEHPDRVERSTRRPNRLLAKRVYLNRKFGQPHLLLIIYERQRSISYVITVIDTSKIAKYL